MKTYYTEQTDFFGASKPSELLFVANNVSIDELEYALGKGVLISCDSISQLCRYGRLNPATV